MTDKLYWADPLATSFEATSARLAEHGGRRSLVLPRTLFYPEGGGQLGDTGTLAVGAALVRVVDTQVDADGTIHHLLEGEPGEGLTRALEATDVVVRGRVDEARRRDHMAQHTAQHALSRALADEARAETVSARLGASSCTIDVAKAALTDLEVHRVEDVVNALVTSDVVVEALYPTPDELAAMPLRKRPTVSEGVRIVSIDGFDLTPCGGTHCTRTGQIGQVRIVALEKYKGMTRLTFHAGRRALLDARARQAALAAAAAELTCGPLDAPAGIAKLQAELKGARAQLEAARVELAEAIARRALDALPRDGAAPLVLSVARPTGDLPSLRALAGKLCEDARVVALCGGPDAASGELVVIVQRGGEGRLDCGAFVLGQARARSGRGGGRPERAEGRFPRGTSLEVLAAAARAEATGSP